MGVNKAIISLMLLNYRKEKFMKKFVLASIAGVSLILGGCGSAQDTKPAPAYTTSLSPKTIPLPDESKKATPKPTQKTQTKKPAVTPSKAVSKRPVSRSTTRVSTPVRTAPVKPQPTKRAVQKAPVTKAKPVPQKTYAPKPVVKKITPVQKVKSAAPATGGSDAARWARIAQCESGGNPATNTGNGFSGLYQFTPQTWAAFGGKKYAPSAHMASAAQQTDIARNVQRGQGWGAWPTCSRR